jgi:hypothetical protein
MASITINFPDDQQQRIRDALCDYGGRTADSQVPRPEFTRDVIKKFISDTVRHQEREAAKRAADALPPLDLT